MSVDPISSSSQSDALFSAIDTQTLLKSRSAQKQQGDAAVALIAAAAKVQEESNNQPPAHGGVLDTFA